MIVYKITNIINNKVYIGQTSFTVEQRFNAHCVNAFELNCQFKLSKALRKYGKENFRVEVLESNLSKEDCNFFEKLYIKKYNSTDINFGYNMTPGGEGGNTYLCKSAEELEKIKIKIGESNSFGNNGNSHKFKMKNIETGEVTIFESGTECLSFFNNLGYYFTGNKRPGLDSLKEVDKFGIQTVFLDKYIFSEINNEFSLYTKVKPVQGTYRWKVYDANHNLIYWTNTTQDLKSHFNWNKNCDVYKMAKIYNIILEPLWVKGRE